MKQGNKKPKASEVKGRIRALFQFAYYDCTYTLKKRGGWCMAEAQTSYGHVYQFAGKTWHEVLEHVLDRIREIAVDFLESYQQCMIIDCATLGETLLALRYGKTSNSNDIGIVGAYVTSYINRLRDLGVMS
jgi:hypothetical protein